MDGKVQTTGKGNVVEVNACNTPISCKLGVPCTTGCEIH